jgi:type IV pilus assembly protein PilV
MRLMNALPAHRRSGGYALLEALIAVIVAAVGFIGAARMQTFGMKLASSSQARQKATLLGYQMTDRIRANQLGFARGRYNDPGAGGALTCLASGCSPDDLAAADVKLWLNDVAAQLPGGQGKVCIDSTPDDDPKASAADWKCDGLGSVLAVKVAWTDRVASSVFVTVVRP